MRSPRVPTAEEMAGLLRRATNRIAPARTWMNLDCGLKTRGPTEVRPAMLNLMQAPQTLRKELA